jgi:thymidine phosphorylase
VAPVQRVVPAPHAGWLAAVDTCALGLAVVALGGGRWRPGQTVDARVGLSALRPLGSEVADGEPLACVHAASEADADAAVQAVAAAWQIADAAAPAAPLIRALVGEGDPGS